jgi:1-acyl-sn-glycerol-3-phosphate acyltransferase
VDRDSTTGRVAQIVAQMKARERFILGISPEGTRKAVAQWKSGFYHVAVGTGAPILLTYLDYSRRVAGIGPLFEPSGDAVADLAAIRDFYDPRWARFPSRF